jgi:hypothetical protein
VGFLQVEALGFPGAVFLQPAIGAGEALLEDLAMAAPGGSLPLHRRTHRLAHAWVTLPEIHRAAGVEEAFAGPPRQLAQGLGAGGPAEAMELLAVNAEQQADVIPAEDGAEDRIQFVEKEPVGHGEDGDDHGTPVAENGSKNQSFEWGKYAYSLRLGYG